MALSAAEQRELDELELSELQDLEYKTAQPNVAPSPTTASPVAQQIQQTEPIPAAPQAAPPTPAPWEGTSQRMLGQSGMSPEMQGLTRKSMEQVTTPGGAQQAGASLIGGPGLGSLKKLLTAGKEGLRVAKRSIPGLGEGATKYGKRLEDIVGSKYAPVGEELLSGEQAVAAHLGGDTAATEALKKLSPGIRDAMAQKAIEMSSKNITEKVLGPQALLGLAMGSPHAAGIAALGPISGGVREGIRQLSKKAPVGTRLPIAGLLGDKNKESKR